MWTYNEKIGVNSCFWQKLRMHSHSCFHSGKMLYIAGRTLLSSLFVLCASVFDLQCLTGNLFLMQTRIHVQFHRIAESWAAWLQTGRNIGWIAKISPPCKKQDTYCFSYSALCRSYRRQIIAPQKSCGTSAYWSQMTMLPHNLERMFDWLQICSLLTLVKTSVPIRDHWSEVSEEVKLVRAGNI